MSTTEQPSLGGKVRALREALGLSQQALAVRAGLSLLQVAQLERGRKRDPRLSTLRALAGALGVDLNALGDGRPLAPKQKGG